MWYTCFCDLLHSGTEKISSARQEKINKEPSQYESFTQSGVLDYDITGKEISDACNLKITKQVHNMT